MRYYREFVSCPGDCKYRIHHCFYNKESVYVKWHHACSVTGNDCPDGKRFPSHCVLDEV